jgi:hypothetical protein
MNMKRDPSLGSDHPNHLPGELAAAVLERGDNVVEFNPDRERDPVTAQPENGAMQSPIQRSERFVVMPGDQVPLGAQALFVDDPNRTLTGFYSRLAANFSKYGAGDAWKYNATVCTGKRDGIAVVDTSTIPAPELITDAQRELLNTLMEECSEVIKCASKILRFGLRRNPYTGALNRDALESELGDVGALMAALEQYDVIEIDIDNVAVATSDKLHALERNEAGRLRYAKVTAAGYVSDPDEIAKLLTVAMSPDSTEAEAAAAQVKLARVWPEGKS